MRYSLKPSIDKQKLSEHKPIILNSGLFLLDDHNEKPVGIFQLRADRKELCARKTKTIPGITDLALRVMIPKLNKIIVEYRFGIAALQSILINQMVEDFERDFLKFLDDRGLAKNELEPQLSQFKKKARRQVKGMANEWYPSKGPTKKQEWFWGLINPLYFMLDKYLTNLETKTSTVTQTDIFHYIAHLLIACGIEKRDNKRGHKPVFERIKKYAYRKGHIKYMGRTQPW